MKFKNLVICGVSGFFMLAIVTIVTMGVTNYNKMVGLENKVEAIDKDMQNVHASIFNNIKSQGLTVESYGDLVIRGINAAMSGRYGATGSGAVMQWIQEQNPNIDPDVIKKLQIVIESGYNRFEATQRTKVDVVRIYKNVVQRFPSNIIAAVFRFPRRPWEVIDRMITTEETKETWKTGNMEIIDPFKKN